VRRERLDSNFLKRFTETVHEPLHRLPEKSMIDVHQHVWPMTLIEALRARGAPPCLREWTLRLDGEPDYAVDPHDHDVAARAALARADGLDLVLISLSSPLGIELLPAREGRTLLVAYHDGALSLGAPFGAWASACLTQVDPRALERELERGFVGLQLPANVLTDESGYELVAPLLDVLEATGRPLMVHPGPPASSAGHPAWWPAVVSYVQQMHASWFAFSDYGRRRHPRLRACFTMLAGLAPVHGERVVARGGPRVAMDEAVFLEMSSYGPRAFDAIVRVLGVDVVVNGSDRPYAGPPVLDNDAAGFAVRSTNPLRLLDLEGGVT
jgi:hypothetical protein